MSGEPGQAPYDINIDADGDAKPDTIYRWEFTTDDRRGPAETFLYNNGPVTSVDDENLLFRQYYTLTKIDTKGKGKSQILVENAPVAPSNTGPASFPDYGAVRGSWTDHRPPTPRPGRRTRCWSTVPAPDAVDDIHEEGGKVEAGHLSEAMP